MAFFYTGVKHRIERRACVTVDGFFSLLLFLARVLHRYRYNSEERAMSRSKLEQQRVEILKQMGEIRTMRRWTVSEQFLKVPQTPSLPCAA